MQASDIPGKFPKPFADSASASFKRTIPAPSQSGGAASLTDGFPPATFVPVAGGGVPPDGRDMNGILWQISQWSRWQAAGGATLYDSAFSTAIGGYPKGAVLMSTATPGLYWSSTVENNTTNPDSGSASGWQAVGDLGTVKAATGSTRLPSGILLNWGNAAQTDNSGATIVTFATPFTAVLCSLATNDANGPPVAFHGTGGTTTTGMTVYSAASSGGAAAAGTAFRWIAIGI